MERFMAKVDASGGPHACHPRSGANIRGYSCFSVKGWPGQLANRWLMGQVLGRPLRRDEHVLHTCDNPPCANIRHLYVADHTRNMRDMINRARYKNPIAEERKARTHCPHGHEYNEINTHVLANGCRVCRRCRADRQREYNRRTRQKAG